MIETFLRPRMYARLRSLYNSSRQFSFGSKRESVGLGMSQRSNKQQDYVEKLNEFYNNTKMQKLWDDTFERISALQARAGPNFNESHQSPPITNQNPQNTPMPTMNNQTYQPHLQASSNYLGGFGRISANKEQKKPPKELFSLDDQQKMKISFAEGYFYGNTRRYGTFKSIMSIIYYSGVLFLVTLIIIGVRGGDGSFKRVLMGNRSYEVSPEEIEVSFSDVKGCDESKQELRDIVEFLRNPSKFSRLGGKLPKGVLLVGPPGTGKTLLARAVAGEAEVPFFHASGSEFDELLVGQGARRVRDLFENAKKRSPCVIFIDEIDSVGGKRSNSVLHPYANQTINQLLSEMDGFTQNEGVIVLGATNRESDLDKALLRPGRFDVRVTVPVPDYNGRRELFDHYLSKVKAALDLDVDMLCRTTTGFTGADIENVVNQAALKAATDDLNEVSLDSIEYARDKILMGPERRSRLPDQEQNLMTAYHEGGHALVSYYTDKALKLHKVTIISRGASLGHTSMLPEKDLYSQTKEQLQASVDVSLGGRVAEELIFGSDRVTTGCSNDLHQANKIAIHMVKDFGMSEKIGMRVMRDIEGEKESSSIVQVVNSFSDATSELVESEIARILEESQARVKNILTKHKNELKMLAEALVKYETLDANEVKAVIEGKDPRTLRQEKEIERRAKLSNLKVGNQADRLPLDLLK